MVNTMSNLGSVLNLPLDVSIDLPSIMKTKTVAVYYLGRGLAETHGNKTKAS